MESFRRGLLCAAGVKTGLVVCVSESEHQQYTSLIGLFRADSKKL
jgi:hypothetical protein